jgi:transcriptional regulator with XRE-family HTH domain
MGWDAVAERVREERARQRLTQQQLASRAQVSVSTITLLERGLRRSYDEKTAGKVWEALGLTLDEMMTMLGKRKARHSNGDEPPALAGIRRDGALAAEDKEYLIGLYYRLRRTRVHEGADPMAPVPGEVAPPN